MKRLAIALVVLLLLVPLFVWFARQAGFLQRIEEIKEEKQAAAQQKQWWEDVERPASYETEIDTVDDSFERVLEAALPEIEQVRDEVEDLSESERYKILAGPEAPLYEDALVAFRQYLEEHFLDVYRERTADTGEAKRLGEQFLGMYLDRYAAVQPMPGVDETAEIGTKALEAGSEDPLLRALYVQLWSDNPEINTDVLNTMHESGDQLEEEGYPKEIVMTVRRFAWEVGRGVRPLRAMEGRKYLAVEAAIQFLAEESDSSMPRFTWWQLHYLLDKLEDADRRAVYAGALTQGVYNEFAMHRLAGWIYRDAAWDARGTGFANTVSEAGWKQFHEQMSRAGQHFMRAWLLDPTDPGPPTALIEMGYAGGDERWSAVDWFHVATRAELDHDRAYSRLLWAMTPRWGGSHQQQLEFAHKCLDTDRWDTIVPAYSFSVLGQIHDELGDQHPFGSLPGVMRVVDRYVDGATQAQADGVDASLSSTNWAYAANLYAQAARYEDAHALFHAFGDQMSQRDFNWTRSKLTHLRGLCAAMTGPANADLPAVRKWVKEPLPKDITPEQLDEPLAELERLRKLDDREVVQPYWDDLAATLNHLQTYHRGEWVEFTPEKSLAGLKLIADIREFAEDGTLRVASFGNRTSSMLIPYAWFEPPMLVEGEFAAWNEYEGNAPFGVFNGWSHYALYSDRRDVRGVVLTSGRSFLAIADTARPEMQREKHWPLGDEVPAGFHHLRMKMWPDQVHHYWQYKWLYEDREFGRDISGRVCFGGIHTRRANSGQMRSLRLRKLDYGSPPDDFSDSEFLEYWQREHDFDPQDAQANMYYGIALHNAKRYDEAERVLKRSREVNPGPAILPYAIGSSLLEQGRYTEAIAELEEAVLAGRHAPAPGLLSWVLSTVEDESLRDPQRALEMAEHAQQENPDNWRTFRALAGAHSRLGNFEQAADWMHKAIAARQELADQDEGVAQLREYLKTIEAGQAIVIEHDD